MKHSNQHEFRSLQEDFRILIGRNVLNQAGMVQHYNRRVATRLPPFSYADNLCIQAGWIIVLVRGCSGQQDGTKLEYCVDSLSSVALLYASYLTWGGFKSISLHSRDARGWSAPWCDNIAKTLSKLRYRMKCLSWFRRISCFGLCLAGVCCVCF